MSEVLKALKKQLLKDDRNGYDVLSAADLEKMEAYCTVYKAFLDAGKTERLSARAAIALAEKHGFVEYKRGMSLSAGDKVYACNRGKGLVLAGVGRRSLAEGAEVQAMMQWVRTPASFWRLLRSRPTSAPSIAASTMRIKNSRLSNTVSAVSGR